MPQPLLSICIPTYNRAELLYSCLAVLAPQVKKLKGKVELVVSDNCSIDETAEVVKIAQHWGPIRYHRNPENVGAAGNLLVCAYELARGEFAWIIGDDDIIRPGGLERVINVLEKYPEIDFVFVNTSHLTPEDRPEFHQFHLGTYNLKFLPTLSPDLKDRYIEKWEYLIDPTLDRSGGGYMMCGIVRLARWKQYTPPKPGQPHTTLFDSYSFAMINAHTMVGRKAYYIGYPCIVTFWGHQVWYDREATLGIVFLQELLDLYLESGVDPQRVEDQRRFALNDYMKGLLQRLLADPNYPGNEFFSLDKYISQNIRYKDRLYMMLREIEANICWARMKTAASEASSDMNTIMNDRVYTNQLWQNFYDQWQYIFDSKKHISVNHSNQYYNTYLKEIGFYRELAQARKFVIFYPGAAEFLIPFIADQPETEFVLVEMIEENYRHLSNKFSMLKNVTVLHKRKEPLPIQDADLVLSLFISQRMPRTLWFEHLMEVKRILKAGGKYIFQFASLHGKTADDSTDNILSDSQAYSANDMIVAANFAGFNQPPVFIPFPIPNNPPESLFYFCSLVKSAKGK